MDRHLRLPLLNLRPEVFDDSLGKRMHIGF